MILKEQVDPEEQVDTEGAPLIRLSGSQIGVLEFMHIAGMAWKNPHWDFARRKQTLD